VCDMSTGKEDTISEKKCTSCEQKLDHKTNDSEVDTSTTDMAVSKCANCGKDGASNTCNKCKQVKYCNAACKKRHRHKHKKDCEEHLRHAAELHEEELRRAAELHDVELFKQPPPLLEDCPICFQRLPYVGTGRKYQSCCGKIICSGCIYAVEFIDALCPFCRENMPSSFEEIIERAQKRVGADDAQAMSFLGGYYYDGSHGLPQDYARALELWHRSAELGCAESMSNIGRAYYFGNGVERDEKKAEHYYELGAMKGCPHARFALVALDGEKGDIDFDRALRHYMIAVEAGHKDSLEQIQHMYTGEHVTKDDYTKALQAYQNYLDEVKSGQRDEAAAARESYKYIK